MDLIVNKDSDYNIYSAKVKKSFVRTDFYQQGNLYYNQVKKCQIVIIKPLVITVLRNQL